MIQVATGEADAEKTRTALEQVMDKRGTGKRRTRTPTVSAPLMLLLIDKRAGVSAYMSGAGLRKEAAAWLARILTKGSCSAENVVAAFLQGPARKFCRWSAHPNHRTAAALL